MHYACWIPKATNTHSAYVILIAFPRLHGYTSVPKCYPTRALPVLLFFRQMEHINFIANEYYMVKITYSRPFCKMIQPRFVYINNRCRYQSITQQYLKWCLIKDDSNYILELYTPRKRTSYPPPYL